MSDFASVFDRANPTKAQDKDLKTAPASPPLEIWGRLEIMGHRVRYGRITEIEVFGTKMARVDLVEGGTELYGGSALYGLKVMTEDEVRKAAAPYRPLLEHHRFDEAEDESPFG